ncbi:MAG TPA: hypothetical protein VG410_09695 [Solirubrobacteraceae bacterium]|nr:hypothetical protein [Solirubrobacteraceae bacterium]
MSRPLIGLLVGTVAFFALWLVALKPSSSSNGSSQALGRYQNAINAAHNVVKASNGAAAAHGGNVATSSAAPAHPATAPAAPGTAANAASAAVTAGAAKRSNSQPHAPKAPAKGAVTHTGATRLSIVDGALRHHRVIVMLFYNPAAADDRAVKQELASVPGRNGRVVKLAVPISEVSDYLVVTNQVNVTQSPTLVLINRAAQASTIVGFADTLEIVQRVDDVMAVR